MSQNIVHHHDTRANRARGEARANEGPELDIDSEENGTSGTSFQATPSEPSSLSITKELISLGKELGYKGEDLQDFVERERDREREERERDREREERERDREREERERDRERDQEEQERERQFQLERLRIETEGRRNINNNAATRTPEHEDGFKPKIPFLSDKDDIESWFHQFEHYAEDCHLDDEKKASRLVYFLTGKARVIYSKLSRDDARDYDALKSALYDGFQLTAEEYRSKFRNAKRNPGDTYKEHVTKLDRYLRKWIELDHCEDSIEGLIDLMLREQVIETLSPELAIHVKDRAPEDAKAMGEIATQYELNRNKSRQRPPKRIDGTGPIKGNQEDKSGRRERLSEAEIAKLKSAGLCFFCRSKGHVAKSCPNRRKDKDNCGSIKVDQEPYETPDHLDKLCDECREKTFKEEVLVKVDGQIVTALRDSGCTGIVVSSELVPFEKYTGKKKKATLADKGIQRRYNTAVVHVDSPYFIGDTEVTVIQDPLYPVLIGNWNGIGRNKSRTPIYPVRDPSWYKEKSAPTEKTRSPGEGRTSPPPSPFPETSDENASTNSVQSERETTQNLAAVTTRSETKKEADAPPASSSAKTDAPKETLYTPDDLRKAQREDDSLARVRELASTGEKLRGAKFIYKKEILYRSAKDKDGNEYSRVVVPKNMRNKVLSFGHDHPMAGHLGQKKTMERIRSEFWWPGFGGDVKRYCLSCDACQRCTPKGRTKKVPLGTVPTVNPAFKKVAVDIVGPIKPMSESKKQYILVMVDYCTRYPEAIALKDIKAETVANALWEFWTRLGIPDVVLTDQGRQFTSNLMKEVNEFLQIEHKMTCPFSPQTNGLVEKFNDTLKQMIKRLAIEQPKKWDTFIPAVLFAYREAPQDSLGFSPFEMLYGKTIKGPMQVLRQSWTDEDVPEERKTTAEYVIDLRNKIEETCKIARENLKKAARKQAKYFNRKTVPRSFKKGEKVLLLRPLKHNKLELTWKGPYEIVEKISPYDYRIGTGQKQKVYHVNLIKKYVERSREDSPVRGKNKEEFSAPDGEEDADEHVAVVVELDEIVDDDIFKPDSQRAIPLLETQRTEYINDIHFCEKLTQEQVQEARAVCEQRSDYLTDVPKTTNLTKCSIKVTERKPVFIKPRPIPHAMVGSVEKEIDEMLKLGVIEPADSPYNSPIVLVKKKDGKYRFCADLRGLNNVIEFDGEPISDVDHLFQSLGKAKFFSKLDLTKGYWSIPIEEEDRNKTAFITSKGQFRWVNMPFGLKTATGVFNRMMRKLLGPLDRKDVHHFMDDILIATESWEEHMDALKAVLKRLQEANVAAKPSKCYIGYDELPYLGHEIGDGKRWPDREKIAKISESKPPANKKEMRSFLGLTGFYRSYVKNYADIATPLTNMTKKENPDHLQWNPERLFSFERLKQELCKKPVLRMPNYDKDFVVRTDASDRGIGAVLLQENDGQLHPVMYQSRKLHGAECNYATVEKECLATVWGIQKFERYLYGRHFILETDHQPLNGLQRNPTNARLMRWSLQLQPYSFTVRVIQGKNNHGADYLSRAIYE